MSLTPGPSVDVLEEGELTQEEWESRVTQQFLADVCGDIKFQTVDEIIEIVRVFSTTIDWQLIKDLSNLKSKFKKSFTISCCRSGKQQGPRKLPEGKIKRQSRPSMKCGCTWKLLGRVNDDNSFSVSSVNLTHSGGCMPSPTQLLVTSRARGFSIPLHVIDGAKPWVGCAPKQMR
jgi:hypothetical protein